MVTLRTTLALILLFAAARQHAQTIVSGGNISGTWNADGNPYIIEGNIVVDPEDRLTIKPGVEVLFAGYYSLEVYGRLDANGTEDEKIRFSLADTAGFSSGSAGWAGIVFLGFYASTSEISSLHHCIIEYSAGSGVTCLQYPNLEINQSEIRHNKMTGLVLYEFSDILVQDLYIHHNGTGGIEAQFSNPQVTDFIIEYNNGPGISIFGNSYLSSYPLFENGIVRYNHTSLTGGGLQMNMDAFAFLQDVSIFSNSAAYGGGVFNSWGSLTMVNVQIQANQAIQGGGIYCDVESSLQMEYCLLSGNVAEEDGGGIWLIDSDLAISRSTITGNEAGTTGGGIYYQLSYGQAGTISNSIVWGNLPDGINSEYETPEVNHSNVQAGYNGEGNIDADPLFENAENGNFRLSWTDYPVVNDSKSPCIDAGDPTAAFDTDGTVADMGAFNFNQETITGMVNSSAEPFRMYPNPASQSLNLASGKDMIKAGIYNLAGQLVLEKSVQASMGIIDISNLEAGIFIVRVTWENGNVTSEKLIKE